MFGPLGSPDNVFTVREQAILFVMFIIGTLQCFIVIYRTCSKNDSIIAEFMYISVYKIYVMYTYVYIKHYNNDELKLKTRGDSMMEYS